MGTVIHSVVSERFAVSDERRRKSERKELGDREIIFLPFVRHVWGSFWEHTEWSPACGHWSLYVIVLNRHRPKGPAYILVADSNNSRKMLKSQLARSVLSYAEFLLDPGLRSAEA